MSLDREFTKGIFRRNPIFVLLLGLCPALAVSTSVRNGLGMGLAATFVLVSSSFIISLTRRLIPHKVRIPCFIVVIASFVTIVKLFMSGYCPQLYESLGIFVPLIVVNCVILGRAEAFASRRPVLESVLDALGMGAGFTLGLLLIASIREILGAGKFFGYTLVPGFQPALIMILPPGAFLTIGVLIGLFNLIKEKRHGNG